MTIIAYPFDGQTTSEDQYSKLFRELQDNGVFDSASGTGFQVSADGTGLGLSVQPGLAMVRGHVAWAVDAQTTSVATADPAARVDLVVLRLDPSANTITLEVLKGTSGSSTPPALTQTDVDVYEMPLAQIAVPGFASAIVSTNVSDRRPFAGGRVGVWNSNTRPTNPRLAQFGFNTSLGIFEYWTGTAWVDALSKSKILRGRVSVHLANNYIGTAPVAFPAGSFALKPYVLATIEEANPALYCNLNTINVTTTGFTVRVFQNTSAHVTGTVTVHWLAMS